ncbi:MAG: hypothetical protein N5P05_002032 [Chroococcopsis gigantea SAG 12.99]|jgi:ribosome-binding protein aMBF1 (putative translation factor)|nr:hypothetical protein [Chlorogloea purpurea SAG 13.99]MDV3000426.1 hypothetical protein [Chroococcopsis gigantea SAG 12.99]
MGDIDDLLNELKQDYQGGRTSNKPQPVDRKPQPSDSLEQLLHEIKREVDKPVQSTSDSKDSKTKELAVNLSENVNVIKSPANEEQTEKRRREALKEKARRWLQKLNPESEEGMWFEEFSYSYESKLEAAMTYLEALKEAGK